MLTYVDERLGARVFVGPDDINRYYRDVLTPEMQKRGQPVPPLEDVREDIRETLKQQKMTQEMANWTQELREQGGRRHLLRRPAGQPAAAAGGQDDRRAKKAGPKKAEPAGKKPPAI